MQGVSNHHNALISHILFSLFNFNEYTNPVALDNNFSLPNIFHSMNSAVKFASSCSAFWVYTMRHRQIRKAKHCTSLLHYVKVSTDDLPVGSLFNH